MRKYEPIMAVTAVLLTVALAACGSTGSGDNAVGGAGDAPKSGSPTAKSGDDLGVKFAQCMRENGVKLPDPEPGKQPLVVDGPAGSKEHKAMEACKQFLSTDDTDEKISPEDVEKLRQYAQCMRANGVNMPDPGPDGAMSGPAGDSAKMTAADQICQSKLPGRN
jgi:hypothetical protein